MSFLGVLGGVKWLTAYEILLCLLNLIVFVKVSIPGIKSYRWLDFVPSLAVVTAIVSILDGNTTIMAIAIYSLTGIVFLSTIKRVFNPTYLVIRLKLRMVRLILGICGVLFITLVLMSAGELRYNSASQWSQMTYSEAFTAMNQRLAREYPFEAWKKLDFAALERKYEPLFKKAESEKAPELYYKTLRDYLFSFRDGHIEITNENLYEDNQVFKNEAGGGFGLSTVQLEDGRVLVNLVLKDSPAEQSGIKLGAEILKWDEKEVKQALSETYWSENQLATDEGKRNNQGRFLGRSPIGKEVQVEFRNTDASEVKKATLKAYDDQYETLKKTRVKWVKEDAPIEGKILNDGYGYVKIRYFLANKEIAKPAKFFKEQLESFQNQNLKGLIIDLRDNPGGLDDLVAELAGYFVKEAKLYEHVSYYNRYTRKFEIDPNETLTIEPKKLYYNGNVVLIINNRTGSSGEGLPLALKGLPNVKIVGFTATNGSFGVISSPIRMKLPEGYIVEFPDGRSLNRAKEIQVDADFSGQGGVAPDIRIPLNEAVFTEKYVLGQDVELKYAMEALK